MDLKKGFNFTPKKKRQNQQSLTPAINAAIIAALFKAEAQEMRAIRNILVLQLFVFVMVSSCAALGWASWPQYATAFIAGGGVSVLNTTLLAWRMSRAKLNSSNVASHQLRYIYFYAAERFLAVMTVLGICLAVLRLEPLATLGGFVLGQAVLVLSRLLFNEKR